MADAVREQKRQGCLARQVPLRQSDRGTQDRVQLGWKSMSFMPRVPLLAVSAAVAAVMMGAAGCSASEPSAVTPVPVPTPTPTSFAQLQLPINAYALTDTQTAQQQIIGDQVVHLCMVGFGFNYPNTVGPTAAQLAAALQAGGSRLWGVSDPVDARTYGYNLPTTDLSTRPPPTAKTPLPPAELAVLYGSASPSSDGHRIPPGGCADQAQRDLAAAGIGYQGSQLVPEIAAESFERTLADPRTLAVFAKWSACMRAHGYDYSSPLAPAADFNLNAAPTQAEIQTAETDVACKFKTDLLGVTFAVQSDYENAMMGQHAQELAQVKYEVDAEATKLARLAVKYGV
jgi:hypothetical protein